ncbi:hypothetical protein [Pseudomonas aeruginosa]
MAQALQQRGVESSPASSQQDTSATSSAATPSDS